MRHLIAFVLAVPLLLAGCQTTSAPDVVPVDPVISTAQRYVQEKCRFVPDPGVISSLLKFFSPNSAGFLEMAQKICAVVAAPQLRAGRRSTPRLHGVVITGSFVR
jgi:hypothetical protein